MNILGESKVLLSFMKPSSSESINVFDMIWQEIIHVACFPLKGCLHAPFIMKMIEVVTQFKFDKGTRHQSYTPFWIDPNNPAGRLRKAPSSSRAHTSAGSSAGPAAAGASRPSPGRGSPTPRGRGRGRGRGMGAHLAHGFAAFFSMCRNIAVDVHEVARRQRETDDNLRRQASSLGTPFAPALLMYLSILLLRRSTSGTSRHTGCLLCQQTTSTKKKKLILMIVSSLSRLRITGIRANRPLTLRPRILLAVLLPQTSLGRNTLPLTWRTTSLLLIILLPTGDPWTGLSLSFWFLLPKRGRRFIMAVPLYAIPLIFVMNNRSVITIWSIV
jgi:hypothetical protein